MSDTTEQDPQATDEGAQQPEAFDYSDQYEPAAPDESEDLAMDVPLSPTAPKPAFVWGTGRRKSSVARVRLTPGNGNVRIKRSGGEDRELNDYFHNERDRKMIFGPLEATQYGGKLDIFVNAHGGGSTGQAGAIVMGLARAIAKYDPESEAALRDNGFMTRDSRMKERKKYGQRGARRRFQFSKR